jgi:hypothetical protein
MILAHNILLKFKSLIEISLRSVYATQKLFKINQIKKMSNLGIISFDFII